MAKKTYKGWEKANVHLEAFLGEKPCEIDERLALYIGECTAPQYLSKDFTQTGEAFTEKLGILHYMTVSHIDGRDYYLGILPEFKQ